LLKASQGCKSGHAPEVQQKEGNGINKLYMVPSLGHVERRDYRLLSQCLPFAVLSDKNCRDYKAAGLPETLDFY